MLSTFRLPHGGRVQLRTCVLNDTHMWLAEDVHSVAGEPSVYAIYGIASCPGTTRRHPVGYTGLTTTAGQRWAASRTKLQQDLPGLQLRGVTFITVGGLTEAMRNDWLHAIEAEITADQSLRRAQIQHQSRAPESVGRLRAAGLTDQVLTRVMRSVLAALRHHERAIGVGTAPWAVRGSTSLRDQIAVNALRLADATGRVGPLPWFLDRLVELAPDIGDRGIARLSDSVGRDIRNREADLVLARMHLDAERVLHVTPRAQAAIA